jgi:hypothetical protein
MVVSPWDDDMAGTGAATLPIGPIEWVKWSELGADARRENESDVESVDS